MCRVTIDVTLTTIQKRLRSIEYKSPQQKTIERILNRYEYYNILSTIFTT